MRGKLISMCHKTVQHTALLTGLFSLVIVAPSCSEDSAPTSNVQETAHMASPISPMDEEQFWSIIEQSTAQHPFNEDAQEAALEQALLKLEPDAIAAFYGRFTEVRRRGYTWDLWAAVYLACGGASDDAFEYTLNELVALGRRPFIQAVDNPDTLADFDLGEDPVEIMWAEGLDYVPSRVWSAKTGQDEEAFYDVAVVTPIIGGIEPAGAPFDEDDAEGFKVRTPRLFEKYGQGLGG